MTDKIDVTPKEVDEAMVLAQLLLSLATSKSGAVGLTGLIMATAVAGVALSVPLEDLNAVFDKSVGEVYVNSGALKTVN